MTHGRGAGASDVAWYIFMGTPVGELSDSWVNQGYAAMGLREDVGTSAHFQREVAAPRASWFSLRRLAGLLAQRPRLAFVTPAGDAAGGWLGVELSSRVGLRPPADGTPHVRARWPRAYVLWAFSAGTSGAAPRLTGATDYRRISLVPVLGGSPGGTDRLGFLAPGEVDWEWSGWDVGATLTGAAPEWKIDFATFVIGASPEVTPLCIFTDGTVA